MPSFYRDPSVAFRVTPRGDGEPAPGGESAGMAFVSCDGLARLRRWPAHLPIRDALLAGPTEIVVE